MNNCGIFDFKLLKNGTYEAELKECTSTVLLFPSNHSDGKKISKFKLAKSIPGEDLVRKIVFQDNASICKLGRRFRKCEEIIIGQGITKIPSKCFEYMFSLKRCELAASVEVIEQKAFYSSRQLETIDIPSDTKLMYIGEDAFESTDSLVTRALLNNCVKHGNSYYLPSKSNPYFFLILPKFRDESYAGVDVHPRCELIYCKSREIEKSYRNCYEMTLGEVLAIAKESSSPIRIGKNNDWIIQDGFLKFDGQKYSLDEPIWLNYVNFLWHCMCLGLRGYCYHFQKQNFDSTFSEATIQLVNHKHQNGLNIEVGSVHVLKDARLFNNLFWTLT